MDATLMKDRADFIAKYGEDVIVVLATPDLRDYELFVMGDGLPTPAQQANYDRRGIACRIAVLGKVLGEFIAIFYVEVPTAHAAALGTAYRQLTSRGTADNTLDWLREKLTAHKPGDSSEWLQALYELKDDRSKEN